MFVKPFPAVNNKVHMNLKGIFPVVLLACCALPPDTRGKEEKTAAPRAWGLVRSGPVEVRPGPSLHRKPGPARLERGALVPVLEVRRKGTMSWTRVRVVDLGTLNPLLGWVDSSQIESLAADRFPSDADLLKQLGGAYLDDFTASHTAIARFLVRQGNNEPALVCLLGSPVLPSARLQIFRWHQGKFLAGPFLEFAFSEMRAGITTLEVRDLLGDGNECLVTREPFSLGPENRGVNMVVRRIEGDALKTVWTAPLEHRNLGSFPPRVQILEPQGNNIGAPGSVTTATVDFRGRGNLSELVWKGKIEFHAVGREAPVETITIERVCRWSGTKFAPLR